MGMVYYECLRLSGPKARIDKENIILVNDFYKLSTNIDTSIYEYYIPAIHHNRNRMGTALRNTGYLPKHYRQQASINKRYQVGLAQDFITLFIKSTLR
jgi:hypothetical protein